MGKPGRHSSLEDCPSCIGDDGYCSGQVRDKDTGKLRMCRTCNGGGAVVKDKYLGGGKLDRTPLTSRRWIIGKGAVSPGRLGRG